MNIQPKQVIEIDKRRLFEGDRVFNNSVHFFRNRLLMCYRLRWGEPWMAVTELGEDLQPKTMGRVLEVNHPACKIAQEDGRLFTFRGRLHCAFTAYGQTFRQRTVQQMYCRLTDDFWLEEAFHPVYPHPGTWEKNWGFFEDNGQLLAVYKPDNGHPVLAIDGDLATKAHQANVELKWAWGSIRGGAPPVRHGGEYYSFFHSYLNVNRRPWYTLGVYTFASTPPYQPLRFARQPLLHPLESERVGPSHVVFPCGAMVWRNQWYVSYGYQDNACRIAAWDLDDIEKVLEPV